MADYIVASRGSLKLKNVEDSGIKKKKKKIRIDEKILEQVTKSSQVENPEWVKEKKSAITKTPAQIAFEKMQEKRRMQKILDKASKTHKQRVEEFNRHLDSLTEHYDIPKVSWTK